MGDVADVSRAKEAPVQNPMAATLACPRLGRSSTAPAILAAAIWVSEDPLLEPGRPRSIVGGLAVV